MSSIVIGRGRGRGSGTNPEHPEPTEKTNGTTQTPKVTFRRADVAFTDSLIQGPVLLNHGGHLHVAEKVSTFLNLAREKQYLTLLGEVRSLMTPLFNNIENKFGPRRSSKIVEKQRFNLKTFICPVLTTIKFLNTIQDWPQFLIQPTEQLLINLIQRLLIMNDESFY